MLPDPFKKFIELLEENEVKFLVVGGYAVSAHGYPRYTGDLDIFVAIDPDSAAGVVRLGDQDVPIISYEMLLRNKSSTSRGKDRVDVEESQKRKSQKGI